MGSSKKTITDLQIVDLLEAGVAEAEGRRNAILRCGGSMAKYSSLYTAFKKDYRKKYSSVFLERIGYAPETTATSRALSESAVLAYLNGMSLDAVDIIALRGTYLDRYSTVKHYLQENYDYENYTETLTLGGKVYRFLDVTNGGSVYHAKMSQWYIDALTARLDDYGYDGTYVWRPTGISTITTSGTAGPLVSEVVVKHYDGAVLVDTQTVDVTVVKDWSTTSVSLPNGSYTVKVEYDGIEVSSNIVVVNNLQQYVVGPLTPTTYDIAGVPNYRVATTLVVAPNTLVYEYVPVVYFETDVNEIPYEVLYVTYYTSGSGSEWYSYVEDLDTVPSSLYVLDVVDMTAILPLKEDNVVYDPSEVRRKRLLRKLGIEPRDLVESLEDPNLDNAYVWTGLPISNTDQASLRVMFETFDLLSTGSGSISVSISKLSMNYSFQITKTTHSGLIMPVGNYSKQLVGEDTPESFDYEAGVIPATYSTLTLRYQGSTSEYQQIVVTKYTNTYTVSGRTFTAYLTTDKDASRLIIPLDIMNRLTYRKFVVVFESSLSMICYSITVVKLAWYQSGWFSFLLKIIAIVIMIYTYGSGSEASSSLWAIAEAVGTAILKGVAIQLVVTQVMNLLGPELGALVSIIAIFAAAYTGNFGMSLEGFKGWLATATQVLNTMNQAVSMKMEELITKSETELRKLAAESEAVQNAMESLRSLDSGMNYFIHNFDDTAAYSSPNGTIDPDSYINLMQGAVAMNFDAMYDVDGVIAMRKEVNSG